MKKKVEDEDEQIEVKYQKKIEDNEKEKVQGTMMMKKEELVLKEVEENDTIHPLKHSSLEDE